MNFIDILMIAVGLSMDAFAVSIAKGLAAEKAGWRNALSAGLWFGGFQGLMPIIGFFLFSLLSQIPAVQSVVSGIDHWIAFVLLALIGGNMIREAVGETERHNAEETSFAAKTMFVLAIATSIDALATGISFACLDNCRNFAAALHSNIWYYSGVIAATTFVFSVTGIAAGNYLGRRFHRWAEIAGGAVLIAIGLKILIEHLVA